MSSTEYDQAVDRQISRGCQIQHQAEIQRLALEQQLTVQDQQHTRELSDAQPNQAALRNRPATADVRLSVLLEDLASSCNVPATPGAVGVVHATRRAQLDPAQAQRIIAITDDGDQGLIANGVSDTIKEVSKIGVDAVKTIRLALLPLQFTAAIQDRVASYIDRAVRKVPEMNR